VYTETLCGLARDSDGTRATYPRPGAIPYPAGRGDLLRAGVRMAHPFETLTPDLVLDAVESIGFLSDARVLALNSYENRVYQVGIEDSEPLIAKFYRPQRWTTRRSSKNTALLSNWPSAKSRSSPR
jgi:hypothetical protein